MGHNQYKPAEAMYAPPNGSKIIGPLHAATLEGEIFSLYTGNNLKHQMGTNGRPSVTICTFVDNRLVTRGIHVLVCTAYHGPRPDGLEVSHLNGDKLDNRPENLAWETPKENIARAFKHGALVRGSNHVTAKLTDKQVQEIRRNENKLTQRQLAKLYNVGQSTISRVIKGHTYKEEV